MVSAEHKNVVTSVNDTVEVLFNQSGTDSGSHPFVWYFNLDLPAKALFVTADKIIQITEINNKVLKTPKPIAANASFGDNVQGYQHMKWTQIKIKDVTGSANVQVFGRI